MPLIIPRFLSERSIPNPALMNECTRPVGLVHPERNRENILKTKALKKTLKVCTFHVQLLSLMQFHHCMRKCFTSVEANAQDFQSARRISMQTGYMPDAAKLLQKFLFVLHLVCIFQVYGVIL